MIWKLLIAQIRKEVYYLFISRRVLLRNWKDAGSGPEAQRNNCTLINTSSTGVRRDEKI